MARTGLTWRGAAGRAASNLALALGVLVAGSTLVWHFVDLHGVIAPRERAAAVHPSADDEPSAREALSHVASSKDAPSREAFVVTLDADRQARGGIAILQPKVVTHRVESKAYGTVLSVEKLTALDNNHRAAVSQLQAARARAVASKAAVERARKLLTIFTTAVAPVEVAEAASQADQAVVTAAEVQVHALARSAMQDWGPVLGRALIDDGPLAARLMDGQARLIQVTLQPEIAGSPPNTITVRSWPGAAPIEATYISPATTADSRIQGASFLYRADALEAAPGVNVEAVFSIGIAVDAIEVPASSIVLQGGRAWIFVKSGADAFKRLPLPDGLTASATGGYFVPVSSLPAEVPAVVVAGAQALLSEESRADIPKDDDDK